jgi:hypothetical protein
MIRFSAAAFLASGLAISLIGASSPAGAVSITVPIQGVSTSFDVLITERSHARDPSLFSIASMPWWGDNSLAGSFAEQVYDLLGPGSAPPNTTDYGPLFAYAFDSAPFASGGGLAAVVADLNAPGVIYDFELGSSDRLDPALTYRYAYVPSQSATTGVPAPIPALGLAMAWGWSRNNRRRCGLGAQKRRPDQDQEGVSS